MLETALDDAGYAALAAAVQRPDLHRAAALRLVEEGRAAVADFDGSGRRRVPLPLLGRPAGFDAGRPNAHLAACAIGRPGLAGR